MESTQEKLKAHLTLLDQALTTLDQVLSEKKNDIVRDATIQRFEYVFELSWKTIQIAALHMGAECPSPREAIKTAFKYQWISSADDWLEALEARNKTSHTYNASLAEEVYAVAKKFALLSRHLIAAIRLVLK